jgi:hypothetical protein
MEKEHWSLAESPFYILDSSEKPLLWEYGWAASLPGQGLWAG